MPANEPPTAPAPRALHRLRRAIGWIALAFGAILVPVAALSSSRLVAGLAKLGLVCLGFLAVFWLFRQLWRRLFWRVGRRLAFSYFLVGVLPIVLIALLIGLTSYLVGGFLLGHLFRDAVDDLHSDLVTAAARHLESTSAEPPPLVGGSLRFADYRDGVRVSGPANSPAVWPAWIDTPRLAKSPASTPAPDDSKAPKESAGSNSGKPAEGSDSERGLAPYVALPDGSLGAVAGARSGSRATLVWFEGDLAAHLRDRTRAWVTLVRSDAEGGLPITRIQLLGNEYTIRGLKFERSPEELAEYYRLNPPETGHPTRWEKPFLVWMERHDELTTLAGEPLPDVAVAAGLAIGPRVLFEKILSSSKRVDSAAWIALAGTAILLLEFWFWAALMALFMIIGLSHAVNRLSKATNAIAAGDFSMRIRVKRKDQLGQLQRSFNTMSERLEELVHTAAQKEAIDQELALARRVQRDLLPDLIETRAGVEVATTFEPSAAIGGDYFDILARPDERIAVAIADVAGHGLAAGLRMAMVKSALTILAEEPIAPRVILDRLHRLLRNRSGERGFVTLTLAELIPETGELHLTNAGHPPCYVVRADGRVEEFALPSSPLGGLPGPPATATTKLGAGDGVVWLSDGIAECASPAGDPFGYERIPGTIGGRFASAVELRDRLIDAVRAHCAGRPCEDDQTLVVLRYVPGAAAGRADAAVSPSAA